MMQLTVMQHDDDDAHLDRKFINLRSGCAIDCYTCLLTCGQDVQWDATPVY